VKYRYVGERVLSVMRVEEPAQGWENRRAKEASLVFEFIYGKDEPAL
jgi:hypothetical protein